MSGQAAGKPVTLREHNTNLNSQGSGASFQKKTRVGGNPVSGGKISKAGSQKGGGGSRMKGGY